MWSVKTWRHLDVIRIYQKILTDGKQANEFTKCKEISILRIIFHEVWCRWPYKFGINVNICWSLFILNCTILKDIWFKDIKTLILD